MSGSTPIHFTPSAADKIKNLMTEMEDPSPYLRIYIKGGGCSGFEYKFAYADAPNEDDLTLNSNGVSIVVDVLSAEYLNGATLDYEKDFQGERFVFKNPNAKTTCGCGNSFSID